MLSGPWPSRAHAKGLELVCEVAPDVPDAWSATRSAAAGRAQPRGQCHQVHRERRSSSDVGLAERGPERRACSSPFATRVSGSRPSSRPDLRAVRAGRWVDHAAVRRNRTGSRHLRSARRSDGRSDLGARAESARAARSIRSRASASQHDAAVRRRPSLRSAASGSSSLTTTPRIGEFSRTRSRQWAHTDPTGGERRRGAPCLAAAATGRAVHLVIARREHARNGRLRVRRTYPAASRAGNSDRSDALVAAASDDARGAASWDRGYLTKPVNAVRAVETMLAVVLPQATPVAPADPLVTRHTLRDARAPLRILLAEDNLVNQDSRRGCSRKRASPQRSWAPAARL